MTDNCTWEMFDYAVNSLIKQIKKSRIKFDGVYGIPRGGLILAVILSHRLDLEYFDREEQITKKTLIVDDIKDTGQTLAKYDNYKVATIYTTKDVRSPDYWVYVKHNDWIVFPWEEKWKKSLLKK